MNRKPHILQCTECKARWESSPDVPSEYETCPDCKNRSYTLVDPFLSLVPDNGRLTPEQEQRFIDKVAEVSILMEGVKITCMMCGEERTDETLPCKACTIKKAQDDAKLLRGWACSNIASHIQDLLLFVDRPPDPNLIGQDVLGAVTWRLPETALINELLARIRQNTFSEVAIELLQLWIGRYNQKSEEEDGGEDKSR